MWYSGIYSRPPHCALRKFTSAKDYATTYRGRDWKEGERETQIIMIWLKEAEGGGDIGVGVVQCTVCVTGELVSPVYTQQIICKYKDDLSDTPVRFPFMSAVWILYNTSRRLLWISIVYSEWLPNRCLAQWIQWCQRTIKSIRVYSSQSIISTVFLFISFSRWTVVHSDYHIVWISTLLLVSCRPTFYAAFLWGWALEIETFWALWNGIEQSGKCLMGLKKVEISRA